jgi:TonB family protein
MRRHCRTLRRWALLTLALGCPAFAQQALFVKQGDRFVPVVAMATAKPVVVVDGKLELVVSSGAGFSYALGPAKTFAPYFVNVRNLAIVPQDHIIDPNGRPQDRALSFYAEFESAFALDRVFLALEVKGSTTTVNALYAYEVGQLRPGVNNPVQFLVRFEADWADCHATLHLFAGGPEVLHSAMPSAQVEHELDLAVQDKIKGVTNASPQPFICPPPEYPPALLGKSASGSATIALSISPTGAVLDPMVKEATLPEFGESAIKAIRRWRFLPRVKDGKPVPTKVELPLFFKPPAEAKQ